MCFPFVFALHCVRLVLFLSHVLFWSFFSCVFFSCVYVLFIFCNYFGSVCFVSFVCFFQGRVCVATEAFKAGDVLFEDLAFVYASELSERCARRLIIYLPHNLF